MIIPPINKFDAKKSSTVSLQSKMSVGSENKSDIQKTFTVPIPFAMVAEKAEKHIRNFFMECIDPKILNPTCLPPVLRNLKWRELYKKKSMEYINFPEYTEVDVLQFFWKLLEWLDRQKDAKEPPFEAGRTRLILKDDEISGLLKIFKEEFLDGLCRPDRSDTSEQYDDLNRVVDETVPDNWLLMKFLVFVGMTREIDSDQWYVEFVRVKPEESPDMPEHFISYLLVNKTDKVIYILYNEEAIKSGPRYKYAINSGTGLAEDDKYNSRLEELLLHEFGHAVNHLDWYLEKMDAKDPESFFAGKGHERVNPPALHEFDAWAYALAVRGIVKSTRSWITRLVEESDDEWYNP